MFNFTNKNAMKFINAEEVKQLEAQVDLAQSFLQEKKGPGSDYLGWIDLPINYDKDEFSRIKLAAEKIKKNCDVFIVIGIGGSYLGARAVIDALSNSFSASLSKDERKSPQIIFAGYQLSATYLKELLEFIKDKDVCVNVISKSGTTTEPALAFRMFKNYLEERYGKEEARNRIFATTDKAKGALKVLSDSEGYETFVVPDDVGGRYSVLTAVGLLPIAVAGIDINELMLGAAKAREICLNDKFDENPAAQYAASRNALLRRGYATEILVNYDPSLHYVNEWWKQLYGESEGKDGKGLFPAAVDNTTDLHSMGQYIQDGQRFLFETVLRIDEARDEVLVPTDADNLDGLNFLAGLSFHDINSRAIDGTILAHVDGGVPNLEFRLKKLDAYHLAFALYVFEYACGLSAHLNAINPFNQPGVEAYKVNMFALLGKPGFEAQKKALEERLRG